MRIEHIGDATLYNADCLEVIKGMSDKQFDIAIVDPPYGDGGGGQWDGKMRSRFGGLFNKYSIGESSTHTADDSSVMPPPKGGTDGRNVVSEVSDRRRPP